MADNLNVMVSIFIIALLGAVFMVVVADEIDPIVNTQTKQNITLDFSTAHVDQTEAAINESTKFTIGTDNIVDQGITQIITNNNTLLVETTDYIIEYNGSSTALNFTAGARLGNTTTTNTTLLTYNYRATSFLNDSGSRSMVDLIPLFFALAILLSIIGIVWKDQLIDLFKN